MPEFTFPILFPSLYFPFMEVFENQAVEESLKSLKGQESCLFYMAFPGKTKLSLLIFFVMGPFP